MGAPCLSERGTDVSQVPLQRERRTNPYPWTWELPAGICVGVILVLVLCLHAGRSVANFATGGGWEFTGRARLFSSIPGIVRGDAGAGLVHTPTSLASGTQLAFSVGVVEIAAIGLLAWALRESLHRWGPGRVHGMANPAEVATLLGTRRLRRAASIIRPDIERTRIHHRPDSHDLGWKVGRAVQPRTGQELWIPWDRTAGVIGPQGSGKTLDLLVPALLDAPGAALVTLTKVDDLLLTLSARQRDGRPCAVLDPFGLTHGLPELLWDPISGCVDPMAAERRAKAFTAGTIKGAVSGGHGDDAARFYAAEASKVLQSFFHAAALADRNLDDLLVWVAHPRSATEPAEILREHPHAAPFWHGLLQGALKGDERTAANTIATVQQAMALFFQADIRRRCVPSSNRAATDIFDLIRNGGTIYLLGREDPYASASPLMTAVAESVLDTALLLANSSSFGRLCPPMLACLDELPSTAPLPTLRTRMANERALGLSFIYASQTWRQLASIFGEQDARALFGLTNVLCLFGGSKDVRFNQEVSDLLGPVRISRHTWQTGTMSGRSSLAEDIPILTGAEVRQLPDRHALVVAENGKPIIARLRRALDGKAGRALDAQRSTLRQQIDSARNLTVPTSARTAAAHAEARRHGLGRAKP